MKNLTIYTLIDSGFSPIVAKNMFDRLARYIQPHHIQVIRNVILKGKATTTTVTVRALNIKSIEELIEDRLINPRRSVFAQWVDLKRVIEALKKRDYVST